MSALLIGWAAGVLVGLVALAVVVALFARVMSTALEIDRYARDIADVGARIATNIAALSALERTRDLAAGVPPRAVAYLDRLAARLS